MTQDAIFNICFFSAKDLGFVNISFLSAEDLEFGGRNMKPVACLIKQYVAVRRFSKP